MKKILLFGRLNDVVKEINKELSELFYVQVCDLKSESSREMLAVVNPALVIVSLVGTSEYDKDLLVTLVNKYGDIPVITVGTEREKKTFLPFYRYRQFEHIERPLERGEILEAACRRLNLELNLKGNERALKEKSLKKTVLVVDDDPVTLRGLREMLKEDFNVTVATSGTQAMTSIGKQMPDLILLDYEMPVCDGRQTLDMIRSDSECKNIPVIFLTGISDREHIEAVVKLKPQGYLLKPASRDTLIEAIKKNIG
ncbi:MAG: response regulator [Lachnospiraceae bacterium]|nr:response regulator [Lachnospiraceae bacterium]